MSIQTLSADFLVIGSGIAGLNFALEAATHGSILLVTKKDIAESNTNYAQGGIAAVLDPLDSTEKHTEDTLKAGSYLNDREAVEVMVHEGPDLVRKLGSLGVKFQRDTDGNLILTQEGGHSARRIAFNADRTGAEIEQALVSHVRANENITVMEHLFVCDLLEEEGRIVGCIALDQASGQTYRIHARITILASGGGGQIYYPHTTNPPIATGDGIAMGLRAGCGVRDMEFFQFHPTALFKKGCPVFLLTESLRGEGAHLVNYKGERFMNHYDERGELATRDIVSRAVAAEEQQGPVFLDCRHFDPQLFVDHFSTIAHILSQYGINPQEQLIPIAPAVHYMVGGLSVNLYGYTGKQGLYAFGEVACTGVHGANRLASNSLLEALVFSHRIAEKLPELLGTHTLAEPNSAIDQLLPETMVCNRPAVTAIRDQLTATMWQAAGIVRSFADMQAGLQTVETLEQELEAHRCHHTFYYETRNMVLVGKEVLKAALARSESIGTHHVVS